MDKQYYKQLDKYDHTVMLIDLECHSAHIKDMESEVILVFRADFYDAASASFSCKIIADESLSRKLNQRVVDLDQ